MRPFYRIRKLAAFHLGTAYAMPRRLRTWVWRACGINVHSSAKLGYGITFVNTRNMSIGSHTYIGSRCDFDNHAMVSIEDGAWIAAGVSFVTSTHAIGTSARRAGAWRAEPIRVGRGAWVGANATILPGISIGRGSVVAAGATVIEDCKPNSLYAGVPATFKRQLG